MAELGDELARIDALILSPEATRDVADGAAPWYPRLRAAVDRAGGTLVGKGIESPDRLARFWAAGGDAAQGYALGRPGPLDDVTT